MSNYHKHIVMGRLGSDPKRNTPEGGKEYVGLSVAVTDKWKTKEGEDKEETTWYGLRAYGKTAEIIEKYLKKGQVGFFELKYINRKIGEGESAKYYQGWEVRQVTLVGSRSQGEGGGGQNTNYAADDIPF